LILAYSGLFLGFLFSGLYLLLHYQIKAKRLGRIYNRFPPLDALDTMTLHANMLGVVFLSIGIIAGSLWAKQVWDIYFGADPKLIATVVIWGIYACYLLLRLLPGWTRKRSAFLSIFGFFNLVFAFALLTSVTTSTHSF
ncbi:MAG: cytochrome c biogenesis protein, partial [Alphaproteobacteria bacterium]